MLEYIHPAMSHNKLQVENSWLKGMSTCVDQNVVGKYDYGYEKGN